MNLIHNELCIRCVNNQLGRIFSEGLEPRQFLMTPPEHLASADEVILKWAAFAGADLHSEHFYDICDSCHVSAYPAAAPTHV
jgi:hypothetical protein